MLHSLLFNKRGKVHTHFVPYISILCPSYFFPMRPLWTSCCISAGNWDAGPSLCIAIWDGCVHTLSWRCDTLAKTVRIFFIASKLLIIVRLEQLKHELVSSVLEILTIGSVPDMWHPWSVGHHGILQYCTKALGNGLKEGVIDECKKISETSSDATL